MIPRGLYGMADAGFGDVFDQARLLAEEGLGVVQLRCKGWPPERVAALVARCRPLGLLLVVNDQVAVARAAGAWVHLGQGDGPDPDIPFGRSTHTLDQVTTPGAARYLGFGPVFGTTTKETGWAPRGLALLAEAVRASPVPVVAIGGVHPGNVDAVRATGVHAWAVIGGVWAAPDPRAAVRALREPGITPAGR